MKTPSLFRTLTAVLSLLLPGTLCSRAEGAAGDVDLSFDPGSDVNGLVLAIAEQPDGKVIIGGTFTTVKGLARPGIARLNADGSGDPAFNPGTDSAGAFALQPDGKVIISRRSTDGNADAARLNSDGTLDGSFVAELGSYRYGSRFSSVVVQPDGKVLLGGEVEDVYIDNEGGLWHFTRFLVVRLNSNGTFDTGFASASTGILDDTYVELNDTYLESLVLQPDGRLLIGVRGDWTHRIFRLNADGSWDSTFNPDSGPNHDVWSVAVQDDGKVLISGRFTAINGTNRNRIARLNPDGSVDSGFNPGTGVNSTVFSMALQADGKVLLGGIFSEVNGVARHGIARLNANGSLDTSFDPGVGHDSARSIVVQTNGHVLLGRFRTVNRNAIARLNADGRLDSTFNPGTSINDGVRSVVLQPDGRVLIAGRFTAVGGAHCNGVARLNAGGRLDSSFNSGMGLIATGAVTSVALQPDGKVLIGGDVTTGNGRDREIGRLNADGSLDPGFNPAPEGNWSVRSIGLQPDGRMLIGGVFGISRLDAAGNVDSSLHVDASGVPGSPYDDVRSVVVQPDGKMLAGGNHLVPYSDPGNGDYEVFAPLLTRFNADGSRDTSFEPVVIAEEPAFTTVQVVALQPDGKVLIGGNFSAIKGASRNRIARLNANGTLDTSFNPGSGVAVNAGADSLSTPGVRFIGVQPDGKVLIAGNFIAVNGTGRNNIARLHADGNLDGSFNPGAGTNGTIISVALQPDGSVLIGGDFTTVNGVARPHVARLSGDPVAPPISFAAWATRFGLFGGLAVADADPDRDGLPNAVEYILGLNPVFPATSVRPAAITAGGNMLYTFSRDDSSETPDATLTVETGIDLATWPTVRAIGPNTASSIPGVTISENGSAPDTITVTIPQGTGEATFARLKVSIAQ